MSSPSTPYLEAIDWPNPYAFKTLQVGGRDVILAINCPVGYTGFIKEVATNWPTLDQTTWQELFIDNSRYGDRIFTPIGWISGTLPQGSLPLPRHYDPPIVFKDSVQFIGQNNNPAAQVFQAYCMGVFYRKVTA